MRVLTLVTCVVASVIGNRAEAQPALELSYRVLRTSNDPLGDPTGIRASLRKVMGKHSIWFGVERLKGTQRRVGSPCGGFPDPFEDCSPEPLTDSSFVAGGEFGVSRTVLSGSRYGVEVLGALRMTRVDARTMGSSGRTKSADELLWGPEVGVDLVLLPIPRFDVGLVVGGRVAAIGKATPVSCEDCYEPFSSMTTSSLHVGVRWHRPRRPQD